MGVAGPGLAMGLSWAGDGYLGVQDGNMSTFM